MRRAVGLASALLLSGCFAELSGGAALPSGGATGAGWMLGLTVGVHHDVGGVARLSVGAEQRNTKSTGAQETFTHEHRGFTLVGDVALAGTYERTTYKSLRLRVGGGWAPWNGLSLTPALTGTTYRPPIVQPAGTTSQFDRVELPHTTWTGLAGLAWDVTDGPIGWSAGLELRALHTPSPWMGDTTLLAPSAHLTFFVTADGLADWLGGIDFDHITVAPPPSWLRELPKGPNTSHSDDDIRKSEDEIRRQRDQQKQQCKTGGPCAY